MLRPEGGKGSQVTRTSVPRQGPYGRSASEALEGSASGRSTVAEGVIQA